MNDNYSLFINKNSIDLDIFYGRNYIETDNSQSIILHRVDLIETKSHVLYGQSKPKDKKYLEPVTLKVMINIEESDLNLYGKSDDGIIRDDIGYLTFGIYLYELSENLVDINRGDIIEYKLSDNIRYYEVVNSNNITDETNKTIGGFLPYWKKIKCIPIKEDVIPFLNQTKGKF